MFKILLHVAPCAFGVDDTAFLRFDLCRHVDIFVHQLGLLVNDAAEQDAEIPFVHPEADEEQGVVPERVAHVVV